MANGLVKHSKLGAYSASIEQALEKAVSIVTKNYLEELEDYEVLAPSAEILGMDIVGKTQFYKLNKLVLNKEENFLSKLTTIVNVTSSIGCGLSTIIKSDGLSVDFFLGIISKSRRETDSRKTSNAAAFRGAILGNLTGSEVQEVSKQEMEEFKKYLRSPGGKSISSVSGVVSMRNKNTQDISGYVQGIENLVDSLRGQKYTIVMIADPIETLEVQQIKTGYETLYTQLSSFARGVVTLNESDTVSLSTAKTESITQGIAEGIALTQSRTRSNSKSIGFSGSVGFNLGFHAALGIHGGFARGTAETSGQVDSKMESKSRSQSSTSSASTSNTSGRSFQISSENRSVKSLLDKIDKHLIRLDECDSFGAFDCATYVITEDRNTAITVAGNYNALMRGADSSVHSSHINIWSDVSKTRIIGQYLSAMTHPRFFKRGDSDDVPRSSASNQAIPSGGAELIVTPATIISGSELSMQVGLPKKSINGVTVIPMAPFGRNIATTSSEYISIGSMYHMGSEEMSGKQVDIDVQSLASHTFITGSTGVGKTTTISSILEKLSEQNIKFLVVEPVKGEYKDRFANRGDVSVYGTNSDKMPLLRINPFSFPEDIHVLEHTDRLIEIFNVCWPLYAAMPAILKDSIERAYSEAGWDLQTSRCRYSELFGKPVFPTFVDVLNQINAVMDKSMYSSEIKGDYKGALITRIRSLTNGLYGQIFGCDEISPEKLFDENVVIDLSRTGASETKSLIMGLLVMKLQEHRISKSGDHNASLKHVTVLEEAHHLLKRVNMPEHDALTAKSVEMLSNAIAEMRTYGEGFIIADQSPGLMDLSVIRNTNTKIILRLPDQGDRELVGRSANLTEEQITELARLKTFVAAVYQNDWLEPVLCLMKPVFNSGSSYSYVPSLWESRSVTLNRLVNYLMMPYRVSSLYYDQIRELQNEVYKLTIPLEAKIDFVKYTQDPDLEDRNACKGKVLYYLLNAERVFELSKSKRTEISAWYRYVSDVLKPITFGLEERARQDLISLMLNEEIRRFGFQEYQELTTEFVRFIESR